MEVTLKSPPWLDRKRWKKQTQRRYYYYYYYYNFFITFFFPFLQNAGGGKSGMEARSGSNMQEAMAAAQGR